MPYMIRILILFANLNIKMHFISNIYFELINNLKVFHKKLGQFLNTQKFPKSSYSLFLVISL